MDQQDNSDITQQQQILSDKYDKQVKQLENQISMIELRQQELQNYIVSLDQTIRQIDSIIFREEKKANPDYNKIKNLRFISSKNIEIITNIYNTYQKFEDVKFKYYKEIDNHSHSGNRLINIELVKLTNKSNDISDSFMDMIKYMSTLGLNNEKTKINNQLDIESKESLEENPEYQL